ncbi:MAG: SDR family NAD(P)-dependent oxidoreductase [Parcubacteria group bacterium]|nr:SDR family NAD(P)-dependent oxidoreductase [Parcubacteria group bacterium]
MFTSFTNIPVLVTGANGFIGSHLTRKLVSLGAKVNAFIGPNTSLWRIEDVKDKVGVYYVDITNFENVNTFIKKIKPVKIYHLAAYVDVTRFFDLIDKMININLKGTTNVLRALKDSMCKFDCFINTGTCEEYGDNDVPFLETQRENPVSPYSGSKVCATYFCQMLYKTQKMRIVTVRPFLTYGPYQTNDMLIPSLIRKCILNEKFEMTGGEQSREFNYVSDIVDGYIKASITEKAIGEIINLGSGLEYEIKDVVNLIVSLTKTQIMPQIGKLPYRSGEAMHFYCSNQKARTLLGWQPKISLKEGLGKTIRWYRSYLEKNKKDK